MQALDEPVTIVGSEDIEIPLALTTKRVHALAQCFDAHELQRRLPVGPDDPLPHRASHSFRAANEEFFPCPSGLWPAGGESLVRSATRLLGELRAVVQRGAVKVHEVLLVLWTDSVRIDDFRCPTTRQRDDEECGQAATALSPACPLEERLQTFGKKRSHRPSILGHPAIGKPGTNPSAEPTSGGSWPTDYFVPTKVRMRG